MVDERRGEMIAPGLGGGCSTERARIDWRVQVMMIPPAHGPRPTSRRVTSRPLRHKLARSAAAMALAPALAG